MRVVELFSGIGGCAAALRDRAEVVCAVDQSEHATRVYAANWPDHPLRRWNLAGVRADRLAALDGDLWWMSPPCQPFTVRGARRDLDDPRCRPLLHLVDLLAEVRPPRLALENVPGFLDSRMRARLVAALERLGYRWRERTHCPTRLGVPMRRRRYYLIASRDPLRDWAPSRPHRRRVEGYLDSAPDPALYLSPELLDRFAGKLPISDPVVAPWFGCFTSAYGRSPVFAGSYWRDARGIRHLSPREILRLLGFPAPFTLPQPIDRRAAWKLVGNSLSVDVVREVLAPLYSR